MRDNCVNFLCGAWVLPKLALPITHKLVGANIYLSLAVRRTFTFTLTDTTFIVHPTFDKYI
jgi:hypothetical protein